MPPMILRELRVALRKRGIAKSRLTAALTAGGITGFFMLVSFTGGRTWGRMLHQYLVFVGLVFGVIRPAQLCIGLLTQERRHQMLELLSLSGIRPAELFVSKVTGGILAASTELLAIAPFLAVPFLSGGVSLELFLATIVVFPVLLLFSVSATLLASALCAEEGGAGIVAACLVALICLATPLPYELGKALTGTPPFSAAWLWLSPGYGVYLIFNWPGSLGASTFWPTVAGTLLWTLLCLGMAAVALGRAWHTAGIRNSGRFHDLCHSLRWGGKLFRAGLRERLLRLNPFQWLAQRDRLPMLLAWASVLGICLLWLGGWCAWPRYWPSCLNFFVTATLMALIVDGLQLHAAARPLADTRQDGTIELLLTTPLGPPQILEGQLAALRAHFRPVRLFMLALFLLMFGGGFLTRSWTGPALTSYISIWIILLLWCRRSHRRTAPTAMWVALNTGRASYAVYRSQGSPWVWFWLLFNLHNLGSWAKSAARFPTGSDAEVIIVALILMIVLLVAAFTRGEPSKLYGQMAEQMRRIAQQPVPERDDPRFKQWKNVRDPFPA
ncbi:MAG TPA: ABC transporter permease [Verrucomicrobiae bacterium]